MTPVSARKSPALRCSTTCGMCPRCVFGPEPPGSERCWWTASDRFRRGFIVDLLLRCDSVAVLQTIQEELAFTSWTLFNYGRSERYQNIPTGVRKPAPAGKPLGLDLEEILDWFDRSSDVTKSRYFLRLFLFCDSELLRMVANLSNVLLVRKQRGILDKEAKSQSPNQQDQDNDKDCENPALMVVPGSSESMSGVSQYRDVISCLPGHLSKRILGLLDGQTLRRCQKVCRVWQHLAQETLEEIKIRRSIQEQFKAVMKKYTRPKRVSHTYANFVEVPVPLKDGEEADPRPQKVDVFKSAYGQIPSRTLRMEERNVYCGPYFTTVLLNREDPHRVVDYRDGPFMAAGSKDRALHLFYVGCELKAVKVLKGHVGSIRAVLLCEERGLVITGSWDASVRCWDLKLDKSVMKFYGHTGAVNCLDVHGDKLVSGSKDHLVKVWSLQTGKQVEKCNFKHAAPVRCVRISATAVYSSCDRGLVKVWDLEEASLLRVLSVHRSSVRCLFLDELHLLSADVDGLVAAWSVGSDVRQGLITFNHPKEVKSLTLVFLRVLTGCLDGKIRVFHFLTGDCLRVIPAEAETAGILSVHFHDDGILVNSKSRIIRLQFVKVFWDYASEGGRAGAAETPAAPLRESSSHLGTLESPRRAADERSVEKWDESQRVERSRIPPPSSTKQQVQDEGSSQQPPQLLTEDGLKGRIKAKPPHLPLTHDSVPRRGR